MLSTPKVKLGINGNVLDLLDIGNVSRIVQHPIKTVGRSKLAGGETLIQELGHAETLYAVEGIIDRDVEANLAKLRSLYMTGKPIWLETSHFHAACKITDLELPYGATVHVPYRLELAEVPFWSRTRILEGGGTLSDLNEAYKAGEILSPLWARQEWSWDRANKTFSFAFILSNSLEVWNKISTQIPDMLVNDVDINLHAWNPNAGAYDPTPFASWNAEAGTHNAFNHAVAWLLDGSKLSDHYTDAVECLTDYPKGGRGETLAPLSGNAGNAVLSQTYGCLKRLAYAIKLPANRKIQMKIEVKYESESTIFID